MTKDYGVSLAELKDVRGTRYERKRTGQTFAKCLFWVGAAACLTGWNGSIGWWLLAATLFGISAAVAVWNR